MVRPGSLVWRSLRIMNMFMFTDDSSLFWSIKKCWFCKLLQHLVVTEDKSVNSLYVDVY